jgi:dienelactone hydrolase
MTLNSSDISTGDPIPICYLNRNKTGLSKTEAEEIRNFDIQAWVQRHTHSKIEVLLKDFLLTLLPPNTLTQKVFAVGYCFGGKHALRLASEGLVAAAAFHPVCRVRHQYCR